MSDNQQYSCPQSGVLIRQLPSFVETVVTVKGWVIHLRESGKLVFIELRDGSGTVQCVVFKGDVSEAVFETARGLTLESSCAITGVVRRDDRAKGGCEIGVSDLSVIGKSAEDYPITPKEHGVAFLMENRHLWIRSQRQAAILRIRATIIKRAREYLDREGFTLFDTPILSPVACEGTTNLFETTYFDEKAYLSQSGQLYGEAGAHALGRIYTFGPTFRAEKSKTRRHLTEFWMVEPEAAFFTIDDVMCLAENFVAYIATSVVAEHGDDLSILERDVSKLKTIIAPFPRISYDEAIEILTSEGQDVTWGDDFGAEHETIISNRYDRPVFITRYPTSCKAFYMKPAEDRPEVVLCCDMLAPEGYGEIIGGGQREDQYEPLLAQIRRHGLDEKAMSWYLDLRKYGSTPHGGFGLGIERTVAWICGLKHVRETIPFPRLMDRIYP